MKKTFHDKGFEHEFAELRKVTRTRDQKEKTFDRLKNTHEKKAIPYSYYISIAAAAVIFMILIVPPLFFDSSNLTGNEEPALVDGKELTEENEAESLSIGDFQNLFESERIELMWFEEPDLEAVIVKTTPKDERLGDFIRKLENVEIVKIEGNGEFPYAGEEIERKDAYLLEFVHDELRNERTVFMFESKDRILIQSMDDNGSTFYFVNLMDPHQLYIKMNAIIDEEKRQKDVLDTEIREKCGWENKVLYRFRLDKDATHPIPCISPIFEEESIVRISTFNGDFDYREEYVDNQYQQVFVSIANKDKIISAGTRGDTIKEEEEYIIYESYAGTVTDNGEPDPELVVVAEGEVNSEYNFFIGFYDRYDEFSQEEIVEMVESIIDDIKREQVN